MKKSSDQKGLKFGENAEHKAIVLSGKESACSVGDRFDPWVRKIPLEKEMATHSSILAWEFNEQRSLVGYCPCGHKKSGKIEQLTLSCVYVSVFGFQCHMIIKYTEWRETARHVTHAEDGMPTCTEQYSRHRERNNGQRRYSMPVCQTSITPVQTDSGYFL